jgi:tRNA (cmo5U34)-methyltransferase
LSAQFHWNPETYLDEIRAEVPRYDELQRAAVDAIPFPPDRVLELGMGTGETTRVLLEAYPDAWVIGLDSDPNMVYRLREEYDDIQLARMEDPLPDGPWDLVISVLSVHLISDEAKRTLFRRVREHSRALVIGDVVKAEPQVTAVDPSVERLDTAEELAGWCGGEVTWRADDLAVVRAVYD